MYPIGTHVHFTWGATIKNGIVVDRITFNSKTRYGIKSGVFTYDVWPNTSTVWEA